MSEHISVSAEQYEPPIKVEDISSIAERYKAELPLVPAPDEETDRPRVYVVAVEQADGEYDLSLHYARPDVAGTRIDPQTSEADKPVFDLAADFVRSNNSLMQNVGTISEAWWNVGKSRQLVEKGMTEVFTAESGDKHMDVLNCTLELLNGTERQAVQTALQHVANYTGNKVFDRAAGIILATGKNFQEGSAGFYNFFDQTVRLNMDVVRRDANALARRYKKYFEEDASIGFMELTIAHELGHAMDISTLYEADKHGIDRSDYWWNGWNNRSKDFSVFDNKFGWTHHIEKPMVSDPDQPEQPAKEQPQNVHRMDDALEAECGEYSPTEHGRTDPREDFAESFAIAALGGNTSLFPARTNVIAEALVRAEGNSLIGPQLVQFAKQECVDGVYHPRPKLTQLEVEVIVCAD